MSDQSKVKIQFKITGTELDANNGYDLYYLSQSMRLFHRLIEKTYLALRSEKNMSRTKRDDLKIKVYNIRDGSFEAEFHLLVHNVIPSLLTMVSTIDAKNVWEMTKLSYDYLLAILKANSEGKKVSLREIDAENTQVVVGNNNTILNIHPDVILTSRATYPVFKKLGNMIDEDEKTFEKIIFKDNEEITNNIEIGVTEKMLLQNPNRLEQEPVKFIGKIYKADANKCTGKLEVYKSDDIETGEYNFEFIDKENVKVKNYFDVEGSFTALKLVSFNPNTLEKSIVRLNIVNVKNVDSE